MIVSDKRFTVVCDLCGEFLSDDKVPTAFTAAKDAQHEAQNIRGWYFTGDVIDTAPPPLCVCPSCAKRISRHTLAHPATNRW